MGKRSDFERKERDFYPTPYEAVVPLLPHLEKGTKFDEPCVGHGALYDHLESMGYYGTSASDIQPSSRFSQCDVFQRREGKMDT